MAKKTSENGSWIPEGYITGFNDIAINRDNVFDRNTGAFKAPVMGIYLFMFQSTVKVNSQQGKDAAVVVCVNEATKEEFRYYGAHFGQLGFYTTYQLNATDTVRIKNSFPNSIAISELWDLEFMGSLLDAAEPLES